MEKYESEINELKSKIEEKHLLNTKYRNIIEELKTELSQKDNYWEEKISKLENNFKVEIDELNEEIRRKDILLNRPRKPEDIPNWAEEYFNDKLLFHTRAVNEISKVNLGGEIDMDLICDAIEFLACEYRDEVFGYITVEERHRICAKNMVGPLMLEAPVIKV